MSKFTYMQFTDGSCCGSKWFVVNAKKYSKEEVIELYAKEGWNRGDNKYRHPSAEDIRESFVAYRFTDNPEFDGEFYTFVEAGARGSFPVWVIDYEDLKINNKSPFLTFDE